MRKSADKVRGAPDGILATPSAPRGPDGLGLDGVLTAWVSASPDAVVVLDSDLRIVYANPAACALFGYPVARLLGQSALMLAPERQRQTALKHWSDVRDGRSEALLGVALRADGSELEVEVSGTVLNREGNRFLVFLARDVTERQRQARQAAALAQAAASVAASDSIDAILEAISGCALAGTRALAAWVKLEADEPAARWGGAAGVPDSFLDLMRSTPCPAERLIREEVLAARRVVVYADWRQQVEEALGTGCPLNLPWQPAAIARLLHRGEAIGLLTAVYREGEIPYANETSFLAALADQAAIAAANARLLAAAREKVALQERQRLARELHDSASQSLFAIQAGAQIARQRLGQDSAWVAQPIDYVIQLAEASQAEMRALIFELRPEVLEVEGLVAALNRQIDAVRAKQGISAQLIACTEPELPVEVKQALYRVGREALWNAVKHARAGRVDVRLEARGNSVELEIADDGVGFDPNGSFPGHLGLASMHERAIEAGGSLEVVSARGRGTRVVTRVPSAPQSPPQGERASRSVDSGLATG